MRHYNDGMGNAGRGSSAFYDLRGKNQKNLDHGHTFQNVLMAVGVVASTAYFLMLILDRPRMGLWIAAIAGVALVCLIIYRLRQNRLDQGKHIDFDLIRAHQISKYAPWMKHEHLGHDQQVDQILQSVDRDLRLAAPGKILSAHLVVGPCGTGKSQFARLLAQSLFGVQNVIEFDFKVLDRDTFSAQFFEMVVHVNRSPCQLILLESIESADPAMIEIFLELFHSGEWVRDQAPLKTSFAGCVFLATATATVPESEAGVLSDSKLRKWLDSLEIIEPRFLAVCSEVLAWGSLNLKVLAEIVCRQLNDHWKSHQIELDYVTPEAVFALIKAMRDHPLSGLHPLSQVIRKKSAQAIDRAMKSQLNRVVLDIESDESLTISKLNPKKKIGRVS